jgi:hypothetical protein
MERVHRMGKADNQRQNDRHYAEFRVDFEYYPRAVASGVSRGTGKTVNLSLGGVYILTDRMLNPDMPIALFSKQTKGIMVTGHSSSPTAPSCARAPSERNLMISGKNSGSGAARTITSAR